MKRLTAALIMVGSLLFVSSPADAEGGTSTFEGSCMLSGIVRFEPALGVLPAEGKASAVARGRCSGTMTSMAGRARPVENARAHYKVNAAGTGSCGGGATSGRGYLELGGHRIDFRFDEVRVTGAAAITLEGRGGGSANGLATMSAEADPAVIATRCSAGTLGRVPVEIKFATTPAIYG